MAVVAIPVDQRVIDIDARRFASVEKGLVELLTNSDDSYSRLEACGHRVRGDISVLYERHRAGARLVVIDQAEGMSFEQACRSLSYGGAHSPLARGDGVGRGYFGRGLKQAVYGLGYGWIETIKDGRFSRIDLFRSETGEYLFDDGGGDRAVSESDRVRLGIAENGTKVAVIVDNPHVIISRFPSLVHSVVNNFYLREMLERRHVELLNLQDGKEIGSSGALRFEEPPARVLVGPDAPGRFTYERTEYLFSLTLKRALDADLLSKGDERTSGLVVVSATAVLDCQLFEYENQLGTEYLFGTVRCPALLDKLADGMAVISDEREGLNLRDPFVQAFSAAVSGMIAPFVLDERENHRRLDHASASGRTSLMIEHLLDRMNRAAVQDMGLALPAKPAPSAAEPGSLAALRFSTPFYYRQPEHPFHVRLLVDPAQMGPEEVLKVEYSLPESMQVDPKPREIWLGDLGPEHRFEWTVTDGAPRDRGELQVHSANYWAWCELVVSEEAAIHPHGRGHHEPGSHHDSRHALARDHGTAMFVGYEFRDLGNELDRAVYSPDERKIFINIAAPTVRLYVDGRGHFRDSARLLLAELLMDVISDELAHRVLEKSGKHGDAELRRAKLDVIRRYGSDIHQSFQST